MASWTRWPVDATTWRSMSVTIRPASSSWPWMNSHRGLSGTCRRTSRMARPRRAPGRLQIAFAEPIRLDDTVVVEGEWGNIEEITLTYVVVRPAPEPS
jgi:hypothetical protein